MNGIEWRKVVMRGRQLVSAFFLRQGGVGVVPRKNRANRGWQLVSFFKTKVGKGGA